MSVCGETDSDRLNESLTSSVFFLFVIFLIETLGPHSSDDITAGHQMRSLLKCWLVNNFTCLQINFLLNYWTNILIYDHNYELMKAWIWGWKVCFNSHLSFDNFIIRISRLWLAVGISFLSMLSWSVFLILDPLNVCYYWQKWDNNNI